MLSHIDEIWNEARTLLFDGMKVRSLTIKLSSYFTAINMAEKTSTFQKAIEVVEAVGCVR